MRQLPTVRSQWLIHSLVLLCYTCLTLLVTYPLPLHLNEQVIANKPGQVDAYLGIWNIWWTAQALTTGQDPFVTPLLFYPQGLDLFWQTLSLPQGLLVLPVTLLVGPLPAYNLLILLSFILGGYTAFLCIRYILRDGATAHGTNLAALVGGAVYTFAPFHMQKVLDAQLEVASIQWLPLWALATLLLLERRRWPWALLSGLALLWVGLGTWYYGLFTLMTTGLMLLLWALVGREQRGGTFHLPSALRPAVLVWGALPILLWFLIMAPRLLQMIGVGDRLLGDVRGDQQAYADLISFWLPNPNHPLWGAAVTNFYERLHPGEILWNVSLGLIGTLLACYGIWLTWRTQWRWLLLGLFAAAMSLGVEIIVVGWHTTIPGPYALIADLPGVRSSHRPNHFVLISMLTTAIFAAAGARQLLIGLPRLQASWMAAGLLVAIIAVDGWAGVLPLFQRPMPQAYQQQAIPEGALLPLPLHLNFSNSEHLWYQTRHGQPIVGGFIGREPPYPLGLYAPGVKELRFGQVDRDDILTPAWPALARETLAAYGIRSVIFHHETMGSSLPLMRTIVADMGLAASYQDAQLTLYPVVPPDVPRPLAYLGTGWGLLEREGDRRWRWMGEQAQIWLLNPTATARPVTLRLDLEAFNTTRPLTIQLGDGDGATFTIEVSRARMQRALRFILPPGETLLTLSAPTDAPMDQSTRRLSIAVMGVAIE